MRLGNFPSIKRYIYPLAGVMLVSSLALSASFNSPKTDQENSENQSQTGTLSKTQTSTDIENSSEGFAEPSSNSQMHVSLKSESTDEKTTGSANVSVKVNGITQNFDDELEKCLKGGEDIDKQVDGASIKCQSNEGSIKLNLKSKSNNSVETKFKIDSD